MNLTATARCPECRRVFNLMDEDDAGEFYYGHDCEAPTVQAEHEHRWGNDLKCQVDGCSFINAYPDETEFCSQCGRHFLVSDDGTTSHADGNDSDHYPYYDEDEGA